MKKINVSCCPLRQWRKILLMMKLVWIFILAGILTANAVESFSQSKRFDLKMKNASLKSILSEIEENSDYNFFYKNEEVKDLTDLSINISQATISDVLVDLLKNKGFDFEIHDRYILIKKSNGNNSFPLVAQQVKEISGKVTDSTGAPLPGVSVVVKGTTTGTITDFDGKYSLEGAPADAILVFSFVGMKTQEISASGKSVINVQLEEDAIGIEEVVAIGYGTQSKRYVTGSISKVNMKSTESLPNTNIGQSLRGRVAGVQFIDNGRPGQSGSILIRGKRSLSASNSPLIVLDGTIFNGTLMDINQNDIKSIEILKDASAAAIYGSKAANGVILITSKLGDSEKPNFNINAFYGLSDYAYKIKLLSPERYLQYYIDYNREKGNDVDLSNVAEYMSADEAENYNANKSIDPWKAASQDAGIKSLDFSVSGKSKKTSYYVSAAIVDEAGLVYNDRQKRISWRSNIENHVTDWLTLGVNSTYATRDKSGKVAEVANIISSSPYGTWYYGDGLVKKLTVEGENVSTNPLYYSLLTKNEQILHNLFANFVVEVEAPFFKGLSYRLNYSPSIKWSHGYDFRKNDQHLDGEIAYGRKSHNEETSWTFENILKYKKQFNDSHGVDITLLYSRDNSLSESTVANAELLASEALGWNSLEMGNLQTVSSSASEIKGESYMARLNYTLKNKYFFTITTRRDGSSVFSANNKYATFPSGAFAWLMSDENFMKNSKVIDLIKFRFSYGSVGNQAIDPYQSLELLNSIRYVFGDPGTSFYGVYPGNMANNELKWETTYTSNIAIDFELLRKRLGGTLEVYNMDTKNLLVTRSIPVMTGFDSVWDNLGETNNKGIELTLNTVNVKSNNFQWNSNFAFSYNKNKIVHLYRSDVDENGVEDDDEGNSWFIGQPIDVYYDFVFDGIYQEGDELPDNFKPGDVRLKDFEGDGINADDRRIIGQATTPKYRWSILNDFTYKNFTLSVFVNAMQGWISRFPRGISAGRSLNFIDRGWWTPENKSNTMSSINYQNKYSHGYYLSRNFVRIQDVSLTYNLPSRMINKIKFSKCEIFVSAKNLYTFTKWRGSDPEIGGSSTSDYFPMSRTISVGFNLGF